MHWLRQSGHFQLPHLMQISFLCPARQARTPGLANW